MARPRVRLVVTADDFGYCPRRDEGIVEAFLAGAVTSVSLLVNGAAAESAAELAGRYQIPTGLHANLSEGRPVGPACHGASTLLSPEGFFLGKMGFREAVAAGDVALPQVREELEAQLIRFRELLGGDPTHVDGHQHVHVLPGLHWRGPPPQPCPSQPCWSLPLMPGYPQVDGCLRGPEHLRPAHVCSPRIRSTSAGPGRHTHRPYPDSRADGPPRLPQCASSWGLRRGPRCLFLLLGAAARTACPHRTHTSDPTCTGGCTALHPARPRLQEAWGRDPWRSHSGNIPGALPTMPLTSIMSFSAKKGGQCQALGQPGTRWRGRGPVTYSLRQAPVTSVSRSLWFRMAARALATHLGCRQVGPVTSEPGACQPSSLFRCSRERPLY
ncbi:carbohydrate deacetylase isoform X1 [Vulpes vulpes]|uniref:Carbohydrate deacetylase n=1 Tax=Vulpes vulpes TaxID=9627 RepID=A0ABM4XN97_VULVU